MTIGNPEKLETSFEREWRARFERFAQKHIDDAGIAGWSGTGLEARVRRFVGLWSARDRSGETWFDAGCGAGTYTRLLEQSGARVIGLDYSHAALVRAKARDTKAAYVVGDVTKLPVISSSVDGVLCFGVTQATSSTRAVARELVRVAKPGAEVWIDGLNCWSIGSLPGRARRAIQGKKRHLRYERPSRMCDELRNAGATMVELHWLPLAPSSAQWFQRVFDHPIVRRVLASVYPLAALVCHSFVVQGRRAAPAEAAEQA